MAMVVDPRLLAAGVGGTLAGSLHAISGPDHLAALLPLCINRRWWRAVYTGTYWGLGHGLGAALVGWLAYCIRGALNLNLLCTYMEAVVGLSIMVIGINGISEAREWRTECEMPSEGPTQAASRRSMEIARRRAEEDPSVSRTLLTGILHGVSGSGHLLGVMPALAMPSLRCPPRGLTSPAVTAHPTLADAHPLT